MALLEEWPKAVYCPLKLLFHWAMRELSNFCLDHQAEITILQQCDSR